MGNGAIGQGNGCGPRLFSRKQEEKYKNTGKCRIWCGIQHETFQYPELQENECRDIAIKKYNLGIALSGGGFRAASLAIGTLRGLNMLGILAQSKYISSNSGSSWVNGPLSYSQVDVSRFLGPYLPPEQCTFSNLRKIDVNSHSYTICGGGNLGTFLKELRSGVTTLADKDTRGFWSQAVGRVFFHDYDLNNFDHLPVLFHSLDCMRRQLPLLPHKYTPYDSERSPFPIINGSIVTRGDRVFAPIEFTPLYYALPSLCKYLENENRHHGDFCGGHLIEPFGFTTSPSNSQSYHVKALLNPNNIRLSSESSNLLTPRQIEVEISSPDHIISVSDQAGISSSAHSQVAAHKISNHSGELVDFSIYPIWNPLTGSSKKMLLTDGGGCDNTGILALLRRKVSKIIAMYAIDQSIMTPVDHRNMTHSTFSDVAGLFGVMTCDGAKTIDGITPEAFNKHHHVFPSEDYPRLLAGLRSRYMEGRPCSYLLHTRVLPNPHISVPGNHEVAILFTLCAASDDWINSLPEDVKSKVLDIRANTGLQKNERDDSGATPSPEDNAIYVVNQDSFKDDDEEILSLIDETLFHLSKEFNQILQSSPQLALIRDKLRNIFHSSSLTNFTYPPIESLDYTSQLVNLLTNLMTWEILESRDLIEELLGIHSDSPNLHTLPQSPDWFVEDFP